MSTEEVKDLHDLLVAKKDKLRDFLYSLPSDGSDMTRRTSLYFALHHLNRTIDFVSEAYVLTQKRPEQSSPNS